MVQERADQGGVQVGEAELARGLPVLGLLGEEPGHWEGDLITGASNRSAIGTLVDRASRYTILLHLPGRHTAEAVRDALIAAPARNLITPQ